MGAERGSVQDTVQVLELDHLIVFLPGPDGVDTAVETAVDTAGVDTAGLVLDEGMRHVGQGTRNRRIVFPDSYIELLWVDAPDEARASGLRFEERCTGDACPFGVVLRGRLPEYPGFVEYRVPAGPTLQVIDDPRMPFLAANESDDPGRLRPANRLNPEFINRATAIERAEIACDTVPAGIVAPGVSFVRGEPELTVTLTGRSEPLRFRPKR